MLYFFGTFFLNVGFLPYVVLIFMIDFAKLGLIMFAFRFKENTANFLQVIKRSLDIAYV